MKKTYVFREAWPYHFDRLFDWISALPICSSAKILLARPHNNRMLGRVKRGEIGPFTLPWELRDIATRFGRANSAVTKWRAELKSCGGGQLLLWFVDPSRVGVLSRDPLYPFH